MTTRPPNVFDRFEAGLVRTLLTLPAPLQIALSGKAPVRIEGETLHHEIQLMLALRGLRGMRSLASGTPHVARSNLLREARVHAGAPIAVASARNLSVEGAEGPLPARHYAPLDAHAATPLLLFLHGGGFVLCDLDTHDSACRILCRDAGVHVLSVEYRLAPEHRFPAAIEDARAALRWTQKHAAQLGADSARVAIGGDSAGGNLATVVTQLAVQSGDALPFAQLLIYPAVDRSTARASLSLFERGFFLTASDIDWFNGHLSAPGMDLGNPWISPLRCESLSGLPPALVVTAAFDPLRDEGEAYAEALRSAGNHADQWRVPGMVHGFINMVGPSRAARAATVELARRFRQLIDRA
ncbi:MAG TPA: alpha/beta hydrolase [Polyangiaceae bacterium]|nr:alpha/beta hydrolase [Polyangiaceae bacterium]